MTLERMHHDMGGEAAGAVEIKEHDYAEWERRIDAMCVLMGQQGITVDERRKHIEMIPPEEYDRMAYYDRWVVALGQALIHRGLITSDELARKLEEVKKRGK